MARPDSTRPRSIALARMRSRSRPPPSSLTWITMLPESWYALSATVPCAGLPRAARTSGASMPWSIALRTRCISGSPIFSTTVLSSSVSSPLTFSSTSLPSSRATSCTTRLKRPKVAPILTMRSCRALSRTSSTRSDSVELHSWSSTLRARRAIRFAPAVAMISSPTRLIRRSSLSASTRTDWLSCDLLSLTCLCLASAASTTRGATWACSARMLPIFWPGSARAWVCSARSSSWAVMLPHRTRISPRRGACSGNCSISSRYCARRLCGGTIRKAQSSMTNSKTFSIAALSASLRNAISKPRQQASGSSVSSPGTASCSVTSSSIVPRVAR